MLKRSSSCGRLGPQEVERVHLKGAQMHVDFHLYSGRIPHRVEGSGNK